MVYPAFTFSNQRHCFLQLSYSEKVSIVETTSQSYAYLVAKGKIGTATSYALKQEIKVKTVLKDGRLVLTNNLAKRGIKSLVMGIKN